jgi:hypothetical protein
LQLYCHSCLQPVLFANEIRIEGGGTAITTLFRPSPIYVITKGKLDEKVQAVIDLYKSEYSFLQE